MLLAVIKALYTGYIYVAIFYILAIGLGRDMMSIMKIDIVR